jgi:hypothetical protein
MRLSHPSHDAAADGRSLLEQPCVCNRSLEHRTQKWEPVLREKMLKITGLKQRM